MQVVPGGRYFTTRNGSSIIAWRMPVGEMDDPTEYGFRMVGAHTDSLCLKFKPLLVLHCNDYLQLGVEVYGNATLNRGVVIKVNANQRYAGTGETNATFLKLAAQVEASVQTFVVRTLDVSAPQWAMHSIREVAGTTDAYQLGHILSRFFTDPRV